MAYFGLEPLSASYLTDYFSGNNTTVAFTLSRAPVSASSVIITISGVKQAASTYGVNGTTLTFSAAPPTGTNNIEVLHLGVQPDTVVQPSYRTITEFTATAGQTTFSPASYTAGYIDVYRNGVKLGSADFTATNGTTVVLANGCAAGDLVRFEGFLITSFNNAIPNTAGAVSDSLVASLSASKLTGSRTLPNSVVPAGSVLQVVTSNFNSTFSQVSSGATLYATGHTLTITPSSASSKILVMATGLMSSNNPSSWGAFATIYRGGTNLAPLSGTTGSPSVFVAIYNPTLSTTLSVPTTMHYLDSPSTTSATTYQVYIGGGGSNVAWASNGWYGSNPATVMTAMEIAA